MFLADSFGTGTVQGVLVGLLLLALGAIFATIKWAGQRSIDREKILADARKANREDSLAELKAINASLTEQRDFFKTQWEEARGELNELRERIALLERQGLERRRPPQELLPGGSRTTDPDSTIGDA